MMRSIAPFWDGNETWLVLGGGGLFVAFPRAYAVIMPALYLPVIVMLLALVFRGVAFEFRTVSHSKTWLERRLRRRLDARRFRAGRHPRRADPGHQGRERRLCRRRVRLGDAVRAVLRAGAGRRLCAARRHLAGDEDGRRGRRARARGRQKSCCSPCWCSWRRSACGRRSRTTAHRRALVLAAEFLFPVAGAGGDRARCLRAAGAGLENRPRRAAVPRRDRAVPARLSRAGDFELPLSGAAVADGLGHRRRAGEPDLHAARHAVAAADHPRLHRASSTGCSAARCAKARAIIERAHIQGASAGTGSDHCTPGRITAQPSRSGSSPAPCARTSAALPAPCRETAPSAPPAACRWCRRGHTRTPPCARDIVGARPRAALAAPRRNRHAAGSARRARPAAPARDRR